MDKTTKKALGIDGTKCGRGGNVFLSIDKRLNDKIAKFWINKFEHGESEAEKTSAAKLITEYIFGKPIQPTENKSEISFPDGIEIVFTTKS